MSAKIRLETPSGSTVEAKVRTLIRSLERSRAGWPDDDLEGFVDWAEKAARQALSRFAESLIVVEVEKS